MILSLLYFTTYFYVRNKILWSKSASKIRVVKNKKWAYFWQEMIANSKNLFQNIGEQCRGKLVSINQKLYLNWNVRFDIPILK